VLDGAIVAYGERGAYWLGTGVAALIAESLLVVPDEKSVPGKEVGLE